MQDNDQGPRSVRKKRLEPVISRPQSLERDDINCHICLKLEKIATAMEVVTLFMDSTRCNWVNFADEVRGVRPALSPKEEALYIAAMDRLEKYIDQAD